MTAVDDDGLMEMEQVRIAPNICDKAGCVAQIAAMIENTTNKKARGYMEQAIELILESIEKEVRTAKVIPLIEVPRPKDSDLEKPL